MSINLGNLAGVQQAAPQTGAQQATSTQLPAFADYSAGDTFQAQVTGVSGDTVTIQTPQGAEVEAQVPENLTINPGDVLDVTVVSKNAGGVELKFTAVNGQNIQLESNTMQSYLMDNGIAPSKLNEGAAQLLVRSGIAPTPRNIANLVQVATTLPEVPTSVALTMAQNNIPPTQQNANILIQWATAPPQLGQDVDNLAGLVEKGAEGQRFSQVLTEVTNQNTTPEQAHVLNRGGLQQLAGELGQLVQNNGAENLSPRQVQQAVHEFVSQLPVDAEQQGALERVLTQAVSETMQTVQTEGQQLAQQGPRIPQGGQESVQNNVPLQEQQPQMQQPVNAEGQQTAQAAQTQQQQQPQQIQPEPGMQPPQGQTAQPEQAVQTQQQVPVQEAPAGTQQPSVTEQNVTQQPGAQTVSEQSPQPQAANQALQTEQPQQAMQQPQTQQPQQTAQPQPAGQETIQTPQENTARTQAVPVQGEQAAPEVQHADADPARPQSAGIQPQPQDNPVRTEAGKIMNNLGKMIVQVRDGSVQDDARALRDGVRDQAHLANMTREGVTRLFGSASQAAQKANDLSAQVRLSGQLDQFYYAQVPFQTPQQSGTADLYVFQRQGQKAEAERTHITVLIGLDTLHMGRVETVLRSENERLNVEFRVENKRIQRFFEDSVRGFREEMSGVGYPLDTVKVSQIGEKVTPVNALKVMEPKQEIRLRGLDIEA